MKKLLFILISFTLLMSSCMTTKTPVGEYTSQEGKKKLYDKSKQVWIFGGAIPLGRTHTGTPRDGNCMGVTKFTFFDGIIHAVTFGFVKTYTIKVYTKQVQEKEIKQ